MNQLSIPLARCDDPLSSHEAADSILPHIEGQEETCFRLVRAHPGFTSRELAQRMRVQFGTDEEKAHTMLHKRLPNLRDYRQKVVNGNELRRCRITGKRVQTWWPA